MTRSSQIARSVVLSDLDDVKGVDDVHGHAAGDEARRRFAAVLRETVRESDVAGRWGGEQFQTGSRSNLSLVAFSSLDAESGVVSGI